jgi:hypothetical protein
LFIIKLEKHNNLTYEVSILTGFVTSGAGTAYPSREPEFTPGYAACLEKQQIPIA